MKIQYEVDIEDLVDSQLQLYNATRVARRRKVRGYFYSLFPGAFMFLIAPETLFVRLIWAASAMAAYVLFIRLVVHRYEKWHFRRVIREAHGNIDKVECEAEFEEERLSCRLGKVEIRFKWDDVTNLVNNETNFELWIGKTGLVHIRRKFFF